MCQLRTRTRPVIYCIWPHQKSTVPPTITNKPFLIAYWLVFGPLSKSQFKRALLHWTRKTSWPFFLWSLTLKNITKTQIRGILVRWERLTNNANLITAFTAWLGQTRLKTVHLNQFIKMKKSFCNLSCMSKPIHYHFFLIVVLSILIERSRYVPTTISYIKIINSTFFIHFGVIDSEPIEL